MVIDVAQTFAAHRARRQQHDSISPALSTYLLKVSMFVASSMCPMPCILTFLPVAVFICMGSSEACSTLADLCSRVDVKASSLSSPSRQACWGSGNRMTARHLL